MEIINVDLYGGKGIFGGKETPLEASVIYCDRQETCSYFKNNQCLNVRAPFCNRCRYGTINNITGYTSRASKYYAFRNKWVGHERYNKLDYPYKKLGLIGNEIVFPYPHINIKQKESGDFQLEGPSLRANIAYIEKEKFTVELIKQICNFKPRAMMGDVIKSYQEEVVPLFLAHLKEVMPEKYKELTKNGEFNKEISYVGRKALLKTINPSVVNYESRDYPNFNEKWYWDGEILTRQSGHMDRFNITKDYEIVEIKIRPSDKSTIEITSNDQVSEKTVFVD